MSIEFMYYNAKSLEVCTQKYSPGKAIRTSMSDFKTDDWLTNIPLYAIHKLKNII
jgi:uncharacterized protein